MKLATTRGRFDRKSVAGALALAGAFAAGFAAVGPGAASAAYARISGSTDCHAQLTVRPYVGGSYVDAAERNLSGLKIKLGLAQFNGGLAVRCAVPSDSNLDHRDISKIRAYVNLASTGNAIVSRQIKACSVHRTVKNTYSCGTTKTVSLAGLYGYDVPVPGNWSNYQRLPVVVMTMKSGDEVRGVTYSDG